MNENLVKKNCPFYEDSESCKKLQTKRNCYQCVLAQAEIWKHDVSRLRSRCNNIEEENRQLKFLLGDKLLKEYQEKEAELIKERN